MTSRRRTHREIVSYDGSTPPPPAVEVEKAIQALEKRPAHRPCDRIGRVEMRALEGVIEPAGVKRAAARRKHAEALAHLIDPGTDASFQEVAEIRPSQNSAIGPWGWSRDRWIEVPRRPLFTWRPATYRKSLSVPIVTWRSAATSILSLLAAAAVGAAIIWGG